MLRKLKYELYLDHEQTHYKIDLNEKYCEKLLKNAKYNVRSDETSHLFVTR